MYMFWLVFYSVCTSYKYDIHNKLSFMPEMLPYLNFSINTFRNLVSELIGSGVRFRQQEWIRQGAILWLHDLQKRRGEFRRETVNTVSMEEAFFFEKSINRGEKLVTWKA